MVKHIVSGVLLLNKPNGISSHTALNQAKRLFMSENFDSKKAGHTGTLDPMATGLLPICLGQATKFTAFGLAADKGYHAVINLGIRTDTGDADGQAMITSPIPKINQQRLDEIAKQLLGKQMQVPPMYSALKKDGKKLYEYARDGVEIEREARAIFIHHLSLHKVSDAKIALNVICSKGTYVRVLGEAIAERLGTVGHLSALHRTQTGGFDVNDAISLDELANLPFDERFTKLLPIDALLTHLPIVMLNEVEAVRIGMGQRLNVKHHMECLGMNDGCQVRLYHHDKFLGVGQVSSSARLQPTRLVA
ncbi:tRNA pseudouridine(55) synthase TruB [Moraxella sp. Tifton1]|uniref:tRNA pseudouridine(55) synthase TruB n=1 Tax=Moraxella oculi TaxID=2940516 RepID=UPI00201211BC|nr:tRNA pseudouridine(55) synthase TruB [Moraxella sp. Tifton1]MCL1623471.1 tRNA pseudouridine(55) synthase TruB [Moraxella sp. Tifton1]